MADRLESRLRAAARELDSRAPAFDVALLRSAQSRPRRGVVVICLVALVCAIGAPVAVPALRGLFDVDEVPTLGQLDRGVAPPFPGRSVPVESLQSLTSFPVRTIPSLGAPDEARVRDDISGGMVTVVYRRGLLLTQWRTGDVHSRIAIVPAAAAAERVSVDTAPALWVAGAARGTFTLVGADGTIHRESFDVGSGALLWRDEELTFLLQGAGSRADAIRVARAVGP